VYIANVDRHVSGCEVRRFFEHLCGPVSRLRLLKEVQNSDSRIAFVEFEVPEGALAALNCSGAVLGGAALRISPSKTPVRDSGGCEEPRRKLGPGAGAAPGSAQSGSPPRPPAGAGAVDAQGSAPLPQLLAPMSLAAAPSP
jgi:hypothetical protein